MGRPNQPRTTQSDDGTELRYTVLVYDDACGMWVKIPEFDLQCLADEVTSGLDHLEELLSWELNRREQGGDHIPQRMVRTIRHVEKDEYGPTQLELDEERLQRELEEEFRDTDSADEEA